MRLASLVLITLLLLCAWADDSPSRRYAGLITRISGTCSLKSGSIERTLNVERDQFHKLYEGDHLHCEDNSSLIIELTGKPRKPASGKPEGSKRSGDQNKAGGRATVEPGEDMDVPRVDLPRGDGMGPAVRAFERGGPARAAPSLLYSPAREETVDPDTFGIEWVPAEEGTKLSLMIKSRQGTVIWEQGAIDGKAGRLESVEARTHLRDYRQTTGLGPLTLYAADTTGNLYQATFYLLSGDQQKSLEQELALCEEGGSGILMHLCRISAFEDLGMLNPVAREYRESLELAPESEALLGNALSACLSVGDQLCAREMRARLASH